MAESACREDGARLWQPRNADAWTGLKHFESSTLDGRFNGITGVDEDLVAIGMTVDDADGTVRYPDGTEVPESLFGTAVEWAAGFPVVGAGKGCVAVNGDMELVNVECDGYSNGNVRKFVRFF